MPPHARMSLAQQLLLRALVARFWQAAVRRAAGALGHRAARSLHAAALRVAGLRGRARGAARAPATRSTPSGSLPHFEFRFPLAGELDARAIAVRAAPGARAVARARRGRRGRRHGPLRRFVGRAPAGAGDAASRGDRYVVTCNGRARAAASDRTQRRVRRRRPLPRLAAAVGLHPTIPVHAPLTFDLVDTWMRPIARRLPVSRDAPGRPQLRDVPGQQLRSREPPAGAVLTRLAQRLACSRSRGRSAARNFRTRWTCARRPEER